MSQREQSNINPIEAMANHDWSQGSAWEYGHGARSYWDYQNPWAQNGRDHKTIPRCYWIRWDYGSGFRGPYTQERNELFLPTDDPVWGDVRLPQPQIDLLELVCQADQTIPLMIVMGHNILLQKDSSRFYANYILMIFESPGDALRFKLKWPGVCIGANK